MEPNQESSGKQLRQEVYQELAVFLRKLNTEKRPVLPVPVVATLIGGLIAAVITGYWHYAETERSSVLQLQMQFQRAFADRKLDLVRTLPAVYQRCGTVQDDYLIHLLWLAGEKNKPKSVQKKERLSDFWGVVKKKRDELGQIETMEGVLGQIKTLFETQEVRNGAALMLEEWVNFEKLSDKVTIQYNDDVFPDTEIKQCEASRRQAVSKLTTLQGDLIKAMGEEILVDVHGAGRK